MSGGHSPIAQFEIHPILPLSINGVDVSFTNSSLWMVIALFTLITLFSLGLRRATLVPGRLQSLVEATYELVADMVRSNVGPDGMRYLPIVFSLFLFVMLSNLLGMLPGSFTVTSHIIITFAMAAFIFVGVTLIGLIRHGLHFFSLFLPTGTPWILAPLMVPIEFFAYLARPLTLSVRLAANMMAGHITLKVIAGFVGSLLTVGGAMSVLAIAPLALTVILTGFEFLVAVLQAYIFTILTCIYLNDSVNLH